MTYQEQQYHQTKIEDYYYYSITKQDNSTTNKDNNKEKVPKELKQWVKRKIFEYCRQLKVPRKGFPSSIVYSAKEMNKLKGYKPTDKTTSYHKIMELVILNIHKSISMYQSIKEIQTIY
jgi:hypothetical protein